jgi:DNA ligase-1
MSTHRLFTIDSADRTRVWDIRLSTEAPGIEYRDGLENGKLKDWMFKASKPMNIGKSNETTAEQQAALMLDAEIGIKLRNNYFYSVEEARSNKLFLPMLADKYEKRAAKLKYPLYVQPKYDGSRCNIYYSEAQNRVVAMSRTGKEVVSIPHIVNQLTNYLTANKNIILDGEIYNHALKDNFEELMSLTRQTKPSVSDLEKSASMLKYYVYDLYNKDYADMPFGSRKDKIITDLPELQANPIGSVVLVPTWEVNNDTALKSWENSWLEHGYEGIMVRVPNAPYKVDGRSADLLKKKIFTDEEFEIVDILEGDAVWKGCAKTVIIRLPDGRTQGAGLKGDFDTNKTRLLTKEQYIGKLATICYFGTTNDGLLRFPVCKDMARPDFVNNK